MRAKLAIVVLLILVGSPAWAGSIAMTLQKSTDKEATLFAADIEDGDLDHMIAVYRKILNAGDEVTDEDVKHLIAKRALERAVSDVTTLDQREAAEAATRSVVSIVTTPQERATTPLINIAKP